MVDEKFEYVKHEKTGKEFKLRNMKANELFQILDMFGGEGQNGQLIKEIIKRTVVEPKLTEENFDTELPAEVAAALTVRAGKMMSGSGVSFLQK
jgi:hypothetical protein